MITPQFLDEIVHRLEHMVAVNNNYLLHITAKHIVGAFERNNGNLMPSTIKNLHKLLNSGMLIDEIQKELTRIIPEYDKEIKQVFLQSAKEIADYDNQFTKELVTVLNNEGAEIDIEIPDTKSVGLPKNASELHMSVEEVRKLEQAYKATKGTVRNLCKTIPNSCNELYIEACDKAYMKVQSGVSPSKAISEAIDEMAQQGISAPIEYTGRRDRIEVALARAVRSGVNKANSEIVLTRCAELGVGYVKVSAHLGARVTKFDDYTNHSWWQGKTYKLDFTKPELQKFKPETPDQDLKKVNNAFGKLKNALAKFFKTDYPDFVDVCGYGKIQGIAGVNCRHSFTPYFPKVQVKDDTSPDMSANEDYYNITQKQRAMERKIRAYKRRIEALNGIDDKKANELKKRYNDAVKEYNEYCKANKLSRDNWRLETL